MDITSVCLKHPYLTIAFFAVLLNIPFGFIRQGAQKFSLQWFFWIHASIPFLIYLRLTLHSSKLFIPFAIFLAVIGQIIGSRLRRAQLTELDLERFEQIGDLRLSSKRVAVNPDEILLVLLNMGGPENIEGVRPFLKKVFSDSLLIRFPLSFILQPLLANLLPALRGKATEHRYQLIGGGSPILKSTLNQAAALESELRRRGLNISATVCFNYGSPFPDEAMEKAKRLKKKYILPLSLYPHYSAATTGSNIFYLKKSAQKILPDAVFLNAGEYYLNDTYINAFVERIREQIKPGESLDDFYILFSAHGLPLYFLDEADAYPFQIAQSVAKIIGQLNRKKRWSVCYQSAVGPLQWLKPSTDAVLTALIKKGERKILVVPIAFVTDHIETLCEIDIEYRKQAEDLGAEDFRMSRALECHPGFISALADAACESLK